MAVSYNLWSDEEAETFRKLWATPGLTRQQIAAQLGRSEQSIVGKAAQLGLLPKLRAAGLSACWDDERTAKAAEMWKAGLSASEIARRLGGSVTRNAVIGKIHRMGLMGRVAPSKPATLRAPKVSGPSKANFRKASRAAKVRMEGPRVKLATVTETMRSRAWEPLKASSPRVWTERQAGECKWPIDVPGQEMHACCLPTKLHPTYCPTHRAMATVRKTEVVKGKGPGWVELRSAA